MSAKRYTKEQKSSWLEEFNQRGGSAAAFCRDREIPYQSFTKWRRAAKGEAAGDDTDSTEAKRFVEIDLSPAHGIGLAPNTGSAAVELSLGNGMILRIFPTRPSLA